MFIYHTLWFFIIYSVLGWMLETVYVSYDTGRFEKRGFLKGPLCPIYGVGAVLLAYIMPGKLNLIFLFLLSVLFMTLIELVGGVILFKLFKTRWWDYSEFKFNYKGYVCLRFSLLWGIAGVVFVKLIHPAVSSLIYRIPFKLGVVFLAAAGIIILLDMINAALTQRGIDAIIKMEKIQAATFFIGKKIYDLTIIVMEAFGLRSNFKKDNERRYDTVYEVEQGRGH